MNSQEFISLNLKELSELCLGIGGEYWDKCGTFVYGLRSREWDDLSYKQVNWLQNIIDEVDSEGYKIG